MADKIITQNYPYTSESTSSWLTVSNIDSGISISTTENTLSTNRIGRITLTQTKHDGTLNSSVITVVQNTSDYSTQYRIKNQLVSLTVPASATSADIHWTVIEENIDDDGNVISVKSETDNNQLVSLIPNSSSANTVTTTGSVYTQYGYIKYNILQEVNYYTIASRSGVNTHIETNPIPYDATDVDIKYQIQSEYKWCVDNSSYAQNEVTEVLSYNYSLTGISRSTDSNKKETYEDIEKSLTFNWYKDDTYKDSKVDGLNVVEVSVNVTISGKDKYYFESLLTHVSSNGDKTYFVKNAIFYVTFSTLSVTESISDTDTVTNTYELLSDGARLEYQIPVVSTENGVNVVSPIGIDFDNFIVSSWSFLFNQRSGANTYEVYGYAQYDFTSDSGTTWQTQTETGIGNFVGSLLYFSYENGRSKITPQTYNPPQSGDDISDKP